MIDELVRIGDDIVVNAYRFPTPRTETDGTLSWDSTVAVVVTIGAGGEIGLGWTYSTPAAAAFIVDELAPILSGRSPFDITGIRIEIYRACRNYGTKGLVAQAISAVDIALWDLKARLQDQPLSVLFGAVRADVPVYGSGGFTSLTDVELDAQLDDWRRAGCRAVKIKIGAERGDDPASDIARVEHALDRIGPDMRLMVDAGGAYTVGQACRIGTMLDRLGVIWFEEPVTSDDPAGIAAVRESVACDVAAGGYVGDACDAGRLLDAVDCLQLDVTRCGGYSGFLHLAGLAQARGLDVSAHSSPALHAAIAPAVPNLRHVEWFVDHARLEPLLAAHAPTVRDGRLGAHADTPGHGMRLADSAATFALDGIG